MIPIFIDTRSLFEGMIMTDEQVQDFADNVIKGIAYSFYNSVISNAERELNTSKDRYQKAVQLIDSGKLSGTVLLDYTDSFIKMIEEGKEPFDMKPDMLKSSKVKTAKNGSKYIAIPMRIATPGAGRDSSIFQGQMPQEIHDIVRVKEVSSETGRSKGLTFDELPEKFQIKNERKDILASDGKMLFEKYTHKSAEFEGLFKKTDKITGQNSYMKFRVVSENSDPRAWIHPGIKAHNIMPRTFDSFSIPNELSRSIDENFAKLF